jgi:hypothetical protein
MKIEGRLKKIGQFGKALLAMGHGAAAVVDTGLSSMIIIACLGHYSEAAITMTERAGRHIDKGNELIRKLNEELASESNKD